MMNLSCIKISKRKLSLVLVFLFWTAIFSGLWFVEDAGKQALTAFSLPNHLRIDDHLMDVNESDVDRLRFSEDNELGSLDDMKRDRAPNATAEELYKRVRVLCIVLTMPRNHERKAMVVKQTWGKRCNKLIFISTEKNESLGIIAVDGIEDKKHLWGKTKRGFKYVWDHFQNQFDWFLKADDDSFVILENLRYMLNAYDTKDPIWFGYRFKKVVKKQGYMSGGGGYVLSREAMRRFVEVALPNSTLCKSSDAGAEDAELGKCLDKTGVKALDSRDDKERERFHPFSAANHLGDLGYLKWYWDYSYYTPQIGIGCCSKTAISFHYVSPSRMRELEYFIYNLIPYGMYPTG